MEGFEHYLESMFGSKGPFSEKIVKQKLENYGLRLPRSIADNEIMKIENLPYNFAKNYNQPKVYTSHNINILIMNIIDFCLVLFSNENIWKRSQIQ